MQHVLSAACLETSLGLQLLRKVDLSLSFCNDFTNYFKPQQVAVRDCTVQHVWCNLQWIVFSSVAPQVARKTGSRVDKLSKVHDANIRNSVWQAMLVTFAKALTTSSCRVLLFEIGGFKQLRSK